MPFEPTPISPREMVVGAHNHALIVADQLYQFHGVTEPNVRAIKEAINAAFERFYQAV